MTKVRFLKGNFIVVQYMQTIKLESVK